MKKITLLLTLLLCVAGTAWAQFSYSGDALDLSNIPVNGSVHVVLKVEGAKADGSPLTKYLATNSVGSGNFYYNDGLDAISTTNPNFIYTVVKKSATAVALKDAHGNYVPGWANGANGGFTNNKSESDAQQAAHQFTFTGSAATGYTLTSSQNSGTPLKYHNSSNRLGVGKESGDQNAAPCLNITFKFYQAKPKRISLAPVARQTELVDGQTYMIYNSANDGHSRAYFLTASNNALVGDKCLNASSFLKKDYEYNLDKYLWTVRKVTNAGNDITYTIQNKYTGMYATASGVSSSPEALLIQRWDAETTLVPHNTTSSFSAYDHDGTSKGYADIEKSLVFTVGKQTGTNQQGDPVYTCWNGSGDGVFTSHTDGHPISFYTFETQELPYAAFTYNYTLNGSPIGSDQYVVELGQPFPSRSINYVNFTDIPEGNVTNEAHGQTYEITSSYTDDFLYKETKTGCLYLPRDPRAYLRCKQDDSQTLSKWLPRANKYEEDTKYYTWTIEGNWFDGFTLKNQGTGKYLTAANKNNATTLNMKSTVSDLAKYDIVYHSNNYFFKIKGTDNCYLSNNGGFQNVEEKALSTWKSNTVLTDNGTGDGGSIFIFFAMNEIDEATMLSNNKAYMKSRLGNTTIGLYDATADEVDALTTLDACKTFMNERGLDIYPSRYYKIVSVSEPTTALYENYSSAKDATYYLAHGAVSGNQVPYLWKFNLIEGGIYDGKYNIQNANGNYLGEIVWNANSGTYSDASQSVYALSKDFVSATNAVSLRWYRSVDAKDGTLERKDDGTLRSWNESTQDKKNNWYILPVESIELDITAAGWASVNLPFAVQLPDGLRAYAVTRVDGNVVYGEEITGNVPANTPVFVAGTQGTKTLKILYDLDGIYQGTNILHGSTLPEAVTSGQYYGLKAKNGGASLVPYNVTTLPANKAVLAASNVPAQANAAAELLFDFSGDVTGINPAISVGEKEVFYDLNGRVVAFPSNGVFVKSNGQKVLIK